MEKLQNIFVQKHLRVGIKKGCPSDEQPCNYLFNEAYFCKIIFFVIVYLPAVNL